MNGIERIARKLCQEDGFDPDTRVFHEFGQPCSRGPNGFSQEPRITVAAWETYAAMVSRTLSAIREPSEAMTDAALETYGEDLVNRDVAEQVWIVMIDALMKRTEPPSTAERLGLWSVAAVQQRKVERQRLRERMVAQGFVPRITGIEDGIISRAELASIGWVEDPNRDGWRRP